MSADISKYIKMLEGLEDYDNPNEFDPDFIAKYITLHASDDSDVQALFTMNLNEEIQINGDLFVTIKKIQMAVSVPLDSDDLPYHNELVLFYTSNANADDEDDQYTLQQMVIDWFDNGEYDLELFGHLTDIGFSQSAAHEVEVEGIDLDIVDYYAAGIGNEIAESVKHVLKQDTATVFSKFGPSILTTNIKFIANELVPQKHAIIKYMLSDIKENGVGSKIAKTITNKLTTMGINWPELSVIQNSLDSSQ